MKKKFIYVILIPLFLGIFYKKVIKKKKKRTLINSKVYPNSILIAEYENYHLECLPGYTKYFTDLGYNVDILMVNGKQECMEKFEPRDKIRIFGFKNKQEIDDNYMKYKKKLKEYKILFLQTLNILNIELYKKIGYYDNPNSFFVIHHIDELFSYGIKNAIAKQEVFSISDYGTILYLNPNYFGEFNLTHEKNDEISFLITSTKNRNYLHFLSAVNYLKNKSFNFTINLIGRSGNFNEDHIPDELKKYFNFYGQVNYQKMYEIVNNSDFIILNLYPDREFDNLFRTYRSTGNTQLSYGFYKPVLIEENFVNVYKFSNETSIIYKGEDILSAMLRALTMSYEEYKKMSIKVKHLRQTIYNNSLNNLKKVLEKNKIFKN